MCLFLHTHTHTQTQHNTGERARGRGREGEWNREIELYLVDPAYYICQIKDNNHFIFWPLIFTEIEIQHINLSERCQKRPTWPILNNFLFSLWLNTITFFNETWLEWKMFLFQRFQFKYLPNIRSFR